MIISHKFVVNIPDNLSERTIYISIKYGTAVHKCCCGCGEEVVTPFSKTDWQLIFDGESISLFPSIGNWNFNCKSHYWIKNNCIEWAPQWSRDEIEKGRIDDFLIKNKYYNSKKLKDRKHFSLLKKIKLFLNKKYKIN